MIRQIVFVLCCSFGSLSVAAEPEFRVGAGKADITGPAAERAMMGYSMPHQETAGIHLRLFARAFVLEDRQSERRAAMVVCDLGHISEVVRLGVLEALVEAGAEDIHADNLMLLATHTHSGPGGYFAKTLYNLTTLGHSAQNYRTIVDGITAAILEARRSLQPASIFKGKGQLHGASVNRSLEPFQANLEYRQRSSATGHLATLLRDQTNRTMTLLRFVGEDGTPIGALNWFAVHQTSMSNDNRLISSDNKGLAALWLEEHMELQAGAPQFVAGFANADEGDVSPNIFIGEDRELSDIQKTAVVARKQFRKAVDLYRRSDVRMSSGIHYAHRWVYMPGYTYDQDAQPLCDPAMGYSFAAGAEDGPSNIPGFYEGMKVTDPIDFIPLRLALKVLKPIVGGGPVDDRCHFPKPILISTSPQHRDWSITTLPFQIITIGSLAVLGIPGEITTMAAYRLRQHLYPTLKKAGITQIVIGGLANSFSGYITTEEEYDLQHYEGAHNVFGPKTLVAYQEIFASLANQLVSGRSAPAGPRPTIDQEELFDLRPGVVRDAAPLGKTFGTVLRQPAARYQHWSVVETEFVTGHPKNNYQTGRTFVEVQRQVGGSWRTAYTDAHPSTVYRWQRREFFGCFGGCSVAKISWQIPIGAATGRYRIVHHGHRKNFLGGAISDFTGISDAFDVR